MISLMYDNCNVLVDGYKEHSYTSDDKILEANMSDMLDDLAHSDFQSESEYFPAHVCDKWAIVREKMLIIGEDVVGNTVVVECTDEWVFEYLVKHLGSYEVWVA